MGPKTWDYPLAGTIPLRVLATSIYKHYKTYPKVSSRIYLPKTHIFVKKKKCSLEI